MRKITKVWIYCMLILPTGTLTEIPEILLISVAIIGTLIFYIDMFI